MEKIQVGIIGIGAIAQTAHLPALASLNHVKIQAVADVNEERAKQVAEAFSIPSYYKDGYEMIEKEPLDGVIICTSNHTHIPLAKECVKKGIHILIEKPIGIQVNETKDMLKLASNHNVKTMVGMTHRFRRDVQIAKEFIENGSLGQLYYAKARLLRRRGTPSGWFTNRSLSGGGAMMDIGVHALDLAWWLIGCPNPKTISAQTVAGLANYKTRFVSSWQSKESSLQKVFNVEDFASAFIRFDHNLVLNIEVSWAVNGPQDEKIQVEIYGSKGGIRLSPLTIYTEERNIFTEVQPKYEENDWFLDELKHFIECIRNNEPPISDGYQGLSVLQMIQAIYESSRLKKEVEIEEIYKG
jgi:predicted dehydrogenase